MNRLQIVKEIVASENTSQEDARYKLKAAICVLLGLRDDSIPYDIRVVTHCVAVLKAGSSFNPPTKYSPLPSVSYYSTSIEVAMGWKKWAYAINQDGDTSYER